MNKIVKRISDFVIGVMGFQGVVVENATDKKLESSTERNDIEFKRRYVEIIKVAIDSFDESHSKEFEQSLCENLAYQIALDKTTESGREFLSDDFSPHDVYRYARVNVGLLKGGHSFVEIKSIVKSMLSGRRDNEDGVWLEPSVRRFYSRVMKVKEDIKSGEFILASMGMRDLLCLDYMDLSRYHVVSEPQLKELINDVHKCFWPVAKHAFLNDKLKILHGMIIFLEHDVQLIKDYEVDVNYISQNGNDILRDMMQVRVDYGQALELIKMGVSEMFTDQDGIERSLTDCFKSNTVNQGADQPDWNLELKNALDRRNLMSSIGVKENKVKKPSSVL